MSAEQFGVDAMTRGCLGGITFCFISHTGDIQPCGYFDMQLGNVKEKPFSQIWTESPVFEDLRDYSRLKGKCGACEYKGVCGGCRARALSATGDYMEEEPYCAYIPRKWRDAGITEAYAHQVGKENSMAEISELQARILTLIKRSSLCSRIRMRPSAGNADAANRKRSIPSRPCVLRAISAVWAASSAARAWAM